MSDEELAVRVSTNDDKHAFDVLIARYRVRVTALARRMLQSTADDAEDLAQEAFVAAFEKRKSFRSVSEYRPWLYRIVINRCCDKHRARKRRPGSQSLIESVTLVDSASDPLNIMVVDEERTAVLNAIDALPIKYKIVFLLRHSDDLTYEQIALSANIPVNTVKTHLFRARSLLREALVGQKAELSTFDKQDLRGELKP